jgi:hypothetical protein
MAAVPQLLADQLEGPVVAFEVKSLADQTAKSTGVITAQVATMLEVTSQSRTALNSVELSARDMSPMVADLRIAVDGHSPDGGQHIIGQGLAQLAEILRAEVGDFLEVMRAFRRTAPCRGIP